MCSSDQVFELSMLGLSRFYCIIKYDYVSDRHGLNDSKAVENTWEKLIEALKLQLKRNHSTEENLFGTALVKLSELRTLGSNHSELLQYYRVNWHRFKIPPLFSEIYDVPKNEQYFAGDQIHSMSTGPS